MTIQMAIHPDPQETRILARSPHQTLLKARLRTRAQHPRALPTLLEALSLWQGESVQAALIADEPSSMSDTNLFTDCFDIVAPTPLFQLAIVGYRGRRGRRCIGGMGQFADLERMLLEEVGR